MMVLCHKRLKQSITQSWPNVPITVAINKIDKPGANPERVIGELAEHGVISTAWGGESEFVEISPIQSKY